MDSGIPYNQDNLLTASWTISCLEKAAAQRS